MESYSDKMYSTIFIGRVQSGMGDCSQDSSGPWGSQIGRCIIFALWGGVVVVSRDNASAKVAGPVEHRGTCWTYMRQGKAASIICNVCIIIETHSLWGERRLVQAYTTASLSTSNKICRPVNC